jgi:excisionase family DNA binding protein
VTPLDLILDIINILTYTSLTRARAAAEPETSNRSRDFKAKNDQTMPSAPLKHADSPTGQKRQRPADQVGPHPDVMTLPEVAEFLQFHPSTVYKLVRRGVLHPFKLGRVLRFNREQIEQLISSLP